LSDNFVMLVDADATIEEAEEIKQRVLDRFRASGIIAGEANEECVLGGEGYRPGPAISQLYEPLPNAESLSPFAERMATMKGLAFAERKPTIQPGSLPRSFCRATQ
jgi:hypothetical protein